MKKIISFIIRKVPRPILQILSPLALNVLKLFYIGSGVECPICNSRFKKFIPYGRLKTRENALCPNCLALERHRLIWLYLKESTNFFTDQIKLLHIAPEACFIDRFDKMKNIEYITADIESPLAKVKMDVHDIPFDDNTFDVVFCNHVLEHVEDDIKAMNEMHRVLKPNGWAIMQSPQDFSMEKTYEDESIKTPSEREKAFGQSDHLRMFGLDYNKRLGKGGFIVKEDYFAKEYNKADAERFALPVEEIIYFCSKK